MTAQPPTWLPEIVSVNGQWKQVLKRLYSIFERDFVQGRCRFQSMSVWWDRRKINGGTY